MFSKLFKSKPVCCWFLLSIIVIITCILYMKGLNGPFLLDDKPNIKQALVNDFSWHSLYYAANSNSIGRPISTFTFALSGIFDPEMNSAYHFKLHNLFIHIACGLLLFPLALLIVKKVNQSDSNNHYIALLATCLWLLHPFSVSTVLYVVQRMTQMASLFSILVILLYCYARIKLQLRPVLYVFFLFLFIPLAVAMGALSKENAAISLLIVAMCEWLIFGFKFEAKSSKNITYAFVVVFIIIPFIIGVVYFLKNTEHYIGYGTRDFNLIERIYTQIHVIPYYIRLILIPDVVEMSLYHDDFPVQRVFDWQTALLLCFIASLFIMVAYYRKKHSIIAFGILWFFSCHVLESTIFPLELVFEHRNYLALFGVVLIISYLVLLLKKKAAIFISVSLVFIYAVLLFVRVESWGNAERLYYTTVKSHPESVRANVNYGNLLLKKNKMPQGRKYIEKVVKIRPEDPGAYLHLALIDCHMNNRSGIIELNNARQIISEKYKSPYILNNIELLVNVVNRDGCPQVLNYSNLSELIDAAMAGWGDAMLFLFKGRLEIHKGDYLKGVDNFYLAFKYGKYAAKPRILEDLFKNQIYLEHFSDAYITLEKAKKFNSETGKFDYLITEMEEELDKGLLKLEMVK